MLNRSPTEASLLPDWEWFGDRMRAAPRPDAASEAGVWAFDVLRPYFGDDWVTKFYIANGHVPEFLCYAPSHSVALVQALEWAAGIEATEAMPGAALLRRQVRGNLVGHQLLHTALQMEVAALAAAVVGPPSFEVRLSGRSPVDVVIGDVPDAIPIEAFVLTVDELMRQGFRDDDALSKEMGRVRFEHGVEFHGELRASLSDEDTRHWLEALEGAGRRVAATGVPESLTDAHSEVGVFPASEAGGAKFSGPPRSGRGWERTEQRLRQKAAQARESGARWLRVDMRDGLWQFSSWSMLPFAGRADNIAAATADAVAHLGLDGVVVSSGACWAQGQFIEQSRVTDGHLGIARKLDYFRARETVIVPLSERGFAQAPAWRRMYEAEPSWLEEALGRAGKALLSEIFAL